MKFENTEVFNIEGALRGMRNPLESWSKSDSYYGDKYYELESMNGKLKYVIGEEDLKLAKRLIAAGSCERKFLRQIFVIVDISAPIYWWKEFDTYKVGTVANSTSTMHKLATTEITRDCFEMGDFEDVALADYSEELKDSEEDNHDYNFYASEVWKDLIEHLELLRQRYNETKDKRFWKELIRLLPESWIQKRTVTLNFENLLSMMIWRKSHKLTEWRENFIDWALHVPYVQELFPEEVIK